MLRHAELALGMALAAAIWTIVLALQSDASATYQICETNQYTGQEHCSPHHLLYVLFWYGGYVFNALTITAAATVAIAIFTRTLYVINRDQLIHNRRVERAYIKMSPRVPPGVVFGPEGRIEVTIEVRNHGVTPVSPGSFSNGRPSVSSPLCFVRPSGTGPRTGMSCTGTGTRIGSPISACVGPT